MYKKRVLGPYSASLLQLLLPGSTTLIHGQTPESDIPPSYRATRRYKKVHLGVCLRLSTLIGKISRVPPFGGGPRRYIRSRLFRLPSPLSGVPLPLPGSKKASESRDLPRAISATELPSNPSPLTFRNNQIQKSYRPLRHTQPWQPTSFSKI